MSQFTSYFKNFIDLSATNLQRLHHRITSFAPAYSNFIVVYLDITFFIYFNPEPPTVRRRVKSALRRFQCSESGCNRRKLVVCSDGRGRRAADACPWGELAGRRRRLGGQSARYAASLRPRLLFASIPANRLLPPGHALPSATETYVRRTLYRPVSYPPPRVSPQPSRTLIRTRN